MTKKYAPQRRVKLLVQLEDKIINVQWSNSTPVTAFYPYFCFYVCNHRSGDLEALPSISFISVMITNLPNLKSIQPAAVTNLVALLCDLDL